LVASRECFSSKNLLVHEMPGKYVPKDRLDFGIPIATRLHSGARGKPSLMYVVRIHQFKPKVRVPGTGTCTSFIF
jgi:hypothetical protein